MKKAIVCGAGGFIGAHLVRRLKTDGFWVRGVDLKFPEFAETDADDFIEGDLRDISVCERVFDQPVDEVYQLAADMGAPALCSPGITMRRSCTTRQPLISMCWRFAEKETLSEFSTVHPPVCTRSTTNSIQTIPYAPRIPRIPLTRIVNTGGKNCSASVCT